MSEPAVLAYHDLELELAAAASSGSHRVRVLGRSPDGSEMRADEAETPSSSLTDILPLVARLERRALKPGDLLALGERLAGLLLPGRVREIYLRSLARVREHGEGLRLRIRAEPLELSGLPWEYTLVKQAPGELVPADFLALQPDVSVTRYEVIGQPLKPAESKETYRAVIALANPVSTRLPYLDVEADERVILAALNALNQGSKVVEHVVLGHASRHELLMALEGGDVFHFAGHGVFEGNAGTAEPGGRRGKIILETDDAAEDPYDTDLLANALKASSVRLVVLGACSTGSRDAGGAWSGVAPSLVRENVPAVVAMQFNVADNRAPLFISQLYLRVLQGYPVDQAVYEGRRILFNRTGQKNGDWARDRDWGTPVLYLRSADGILFPGDSSEAAQTGAASLRARQKIATLEGEAVAVLADALVAGQLDINQEVGEVKAGGSLIGAKLRTIGGKPSP